MYPAGCRGNYWMVGRHQELWCHPPNFVGVLQTASIWLPWLLKDAPLIPLSLSVRLVLVSYSIPYCLINITLSFLLLLYLPALLYVTRGRRFSSLSQVVAFHHPNATISIALFLFFCTHP